MIFPPFALKRDIEDYLTNDLNIGIYEALTENKGRKILFEPLNFINTLYEQHLIIIANKTKPISVLEHLRALPLNKDQLYYLLLHLVYLNNFILRENYDDNRLIIICDFITKEFTKLERELFPNDISELEIWKNQNANNSTENSKADKIFDKQTISNLSLREIALICHYTNKVVTRKNGNDIAKLYSFNSGDRLYNLYTHYQSSQNRTGDEGTSKKNSIKLNLLLKIIKYLKVNDLPTVKAIAEMNSFKSKAGL